MNGGGGSGGGYELSMQYNQTVDIVLKWNIRRRAKHIGSQKFLSWSNAGT